MKLKLKADTKGQFGFVEIYKPYSFSIGAVKMFVVANAGGYLAEPYVYRGGEFVPAKTINEEMGIEKYIKAKKPFYSVLGTGNVILDLRVAFDCETKEYVKANSYFKIYGMVKDSLAQIDDDWSIDIRQYSTISPEIIKWVDDISERIAKTGSNRELFLKSRFE